MFEPEPAAEMIVTEALAPTDIITNLEAYTKASEIWNAYAGDDLDTLKVFDGHIHSDLGNTLIAKYHTLDRHEFAYLISEAQQTANMRAGHTYRIYARYCRGNVRNIRQFVKVEIIDDWALVGPSGSAIMIGRIQL